MHIKFNKYSYHGKNLIHQIKLILNMTEIFAQTVILD